MAIDFIPRKDSEALSWMLNFTQWLQANGAAHGFSPAKIAALTAEAGAFGAAMTDNQTAQAAAKAATQVKNTARASAVEICRAYARQLQGIPEISDADRAAAGLTIPDTIPTRIAPDAVMTIPPPQLVLDFGIRRQVTIHWGPNPMNERNNARPAGTHGCEIQAARGGIPSDEAAWQVLKLDTESPLIHQTNETEPVTYAYRARYLGKRLTLGPFGDPVTCTVTA